jgi:hypothetical protein
MPDKHFEIAVRDRLLLPSAKKAPAANTGGLMAVFATPYWTHGGTMPGNAA